MLVKEIFDNNGHSYFDWLYFQLIIEYDYLIIIIFKVQFLVYQDINKIHINII